MDKINKDEHFMKQINKIKLGCNNHDNIYTDPSDMINPDGTKAYAYATLVMLGDKYIPGAIVLAESIRKLGSLSDLVVMVTDDVTTEGISLLKRFYDHVIDIKYISNDISKDLEYQNVTKTKFNAYKLTQYKKIILIDADSIILKFPDHLFTLNTPAGIYLPNREDVINVNRDGELVYDLPIKWYKKYCKSLPHGSTIPKDLIKHDNMIHTSLLLIEPNIEKYNNILKEINHLDKIKNWFSIDPLFLGFRGYPHWSILYGIHFGKNKPFILESKTPINERLNFDDFKIWFYFWREIINKNYELLDYEFLKDVNHLAKYFSIQLSRSTIEIKNGLSNGLIESIKKIFNLGDKIVKNYNYYHINISKEYDNDDVTYRTNNDLLINMIEYIVETTNSEYWKKILNKVKNINSLDYDLSKINDENKKLLEKYDLIDRDNLMIQYTKINENTNIIIIINEDTKSEKHKNDDDRENIIYEKEYKINGKILKNILFWIDNKFVYSERKIFLDKNYKDEIEYKINFYIYKTIFDADLKSSNKNVYVFNEVAMKLRILSIFLNSNTMDKFITNQIVMMYNTNNLKDNSIFIKNNLMYQTLKKWIYNIYNGDQMDNILIINKLVFSDELEQDNFLLLDNNIYTKEDDIQYARNKKIEFIDLVFTNSSDKKYNKYLNSIYDPRLYYQLDGIKFCL